MHLYLERIPTTCGVVLKYQNVYLSAIGYQLPELKISTRQLEERLASVYQKLRVPMGQLEFLTGIKERRWWPEGFLVSDGATLAAKKALNILGAKGSELDILIYGGVCRDYIEPATACKIAHDIGAPSHAAVYDVSNACLGALNGLVDIANRIQLGQAKLGMVVSCESARDINEDTIAQLEANPSMENFKESLATLTGGSGAVAMILSSEPIGKGHRILGGASRASSQHHNLCRWGMRRKGASAFEQFLNTDPVSVMKHGVQLGMKTFDALLKELSWDREQVDRTISHQVGKSHQQSIMKALGLASNIDFPTYPYLGNMGTVSLPLSAAIAEEQGFLKTGDRVSFMGIGSGLNCMMLGVQW